MKKLLALTCLLALVCGVTPANASVCAGSVTFVGLNQAGFVWVSMVLPPPAPGQPSPGGFSYGAVCQVGGTANGWTSDACKAIYSQLLVAESTGAPMQFYFNDNTNCTTQTPTPWTTLTGLYFVAQQK